VEGLRSARAHSRVPCARIGRGDPHRSRGGARGRLRTWASQAFALLVTLAVTPAEAAGPLGRQGAPLDTSRYTVDLFQGPLAASNRVTGLAGAVAPLAEGIDMHAFNAASPAVRTASSRSVTEFDISAGLTLPGGIRDLDYDNNGKRGFAYDNFFFVTMAGQVQQGPFGLGATVDVQQYDLGATTGAEGVSSVAFRLVQARLLAATAVGDELTIGGGLRGVLFTLRDAALSGIGFSSITDLRGVLTMAGVGPEVGALWAPLRLPLRMGLSLRAPVAGQLIPGDTTVVDASGDRRLGKLYLPDRVEVPWQIEWGVAVQLGPRPLNVKWLDSTAVQHEVVESHRKTPDEPRSAVVSRMGRRAYERLPREKLLLSISFTATGPVANAVGLESFLAGQIDRSGERVSLTPRLGVETEAWPNRMMFRAGTYSEPTRFRGGARRLHGTVGMDLKTFSSDVFGLYEDPLPFRIGGSLDFAREYFGWSVTAGIWN